MKKQATKAPESSSSKAQHGRFSKKAKILIASCAGAAFLVVVAIIVVLAITNRAKADQLAKEQEITDKIETCVKETKKDMLGFASLCYEENGRDIPEDVKTKDKERVDRILAQSNYDICIANAELSYSILWDLNDDDPQNGKADGLPVQFAEPIQRDYEQKIENCKVAYSLVGNYESDFKTSYRKVLTGWATPLSDEIAIIDRYNTDGIIPEGSNMRVTEEIPDSVGSVGNLAATEFKNKHLDWWY